MSRGFGPSVINAQQKQEAKVLKKSVLNYFQELKDPRVERTQQHRLESIVAIAILAVLSGADGFVAIETYGKSKKAWLETFLELPNGIPSHDTFGRVFGALDPQVLEERFLGWVSHITESLDINLIHIDGKVSRGSYDREGKLKALHTVSAWSSEHSLVLGQYKVDGKSNEISAVPLLLKLLDLTGSIITLDAMGAQTAIARQIRQGGGDYVLSLKGNQGKLSQQVSAWFEEAERKGWVGIEYSYDETVNAGHGRTETRQVWAVHVNQLPGLHRQGQWEGLTTVIMVRSRNDERR
jgi:predicted transposase YbfD/YdcC